MKIMIVKSMSYEEIQRECLQELKEENLSRAYSIVENNNKYRRYILKNKKKCSESNVFFKPFTIKSNRNNTILVIPACYNGNLVVFCSVIYNFGSGNYVFSFNASGNSIIFTPHFLTRYKERCLKDNSISNFDVICEFTKSIVNNRTGVLLSIEEANIPEDILIKIKSKYPGEHYISSKENGLAIVEKVNKDILIYKTMLSVDILKENQLDDLYQMYRTAVRHKVTSKIARHMINGEVIII